MKKILILKVAGVFIFCSFFFLIIITILALVGFSFGIDEMQKAQEDIRVNTPVVNNQIYSNTYMRLLNENMYERGYVSLERLVFHLQRTNNVLDTSSLSYENWKLAYIENSNKELMQMIPIKTMCNKYKEEYPKYTISSNISKYSNVWIDKIDLCYITDLESKEVIDITDSLDYFEDYDYLPFVFPLNIKAKPMITSYLFEQREIDFNLPPEQAGNINFHSGWDFDGSIGTQIYSVCDGTVTKEVFTQNNDLSYYNQASPKNGIGNYVEVTCDNGIIVEYKHIKYNSLELSFNMNKRVKAGDKLVKVSTTGLSTGPHLHISARDKTGKRIDIMQYINFKSNKLLG